MVPGIFLALDVYFLLPLSLMLFLHVTILPSGKLFTILFGFSTNIHCLKSIKTY